MTYILALDAGTGSIRAVLFNRKGQEIKTSQQEWSHIENPIYPGSMDFDYQSNWILIVQCIKEVICKAGISSNEIKAISATSMREGFVLYNQKKEEIWACANVDARAGEEVRLLKENHPDLEQKIYQTSGQTFALGALPRLLWLKRNQPEIYEQTHSISMLNDWILYKLSGLLQVDPSNGCTTGIFDLKKRNWEPSIAIDCQLKNNLFTSVHEAGTVFGSVSRVASSITGLTEGTPIVTGGGDASMASVGVGAILDGQTVISGGSFWQQEVNIKQPTIDQEGRIRINCHAVRDLWQLETIVFFPGLVMRWFRDAFCEKEKAIAKTTGRDTYEILEALAASVPVGSNGIIPIFSDTMNYMNWRHAAPSFLNLSIDPQKTGKKELFKSLQENAALITWGNLKRIKEITNFYPQEVIFAGGASKGKLWSQTLADVLGVPVKVPVVKEAAALGTALFAGVGVGIYSSIQEAVEIAVKWERVHQPNMENHQKYAELYKTWRKVYAIQLQMADSGLTQHMWKAPGL